jgi:hypothetical protein
VSVDPFADGLRPVAKGRFGQAREKDLSHPRQRRRRVVRHPERRERWHVAQMAKFEIVPVGNTPAEFAAFIAEETDRWAAVVTRLNLKVE